MDFYSRVKQLAKKLRHPSLQEFIISTGMNHDSYYTLKRAGNLPRADDALRIAKALGTTVEYLLEGSNPAPLTVDETVDEIEIIIEKYRKNTGRFNRRKI